jgi:hypothetical protein
MQNLTGFEDSYTELIHNHHEFDLHCGAQTPLAPRALAYLQTGPLRECVTLYLVDNSQNEKLVDATQFSKTFALLHDLKSHVEAGNTRRLTKAYVTKLGAGKQIYPHSDTAAPYFNNIERYQFYYTGTSEVSQIIDNTLFPVKPGDLYYFDHRQIHSYHNNSSIDLILMVFDLAI